MGKIIKISGFLVFLTLGLFVVFFEPFTGLDFLGHFVVMNLIVTIGLWIFEPWGIPSGVSGLFCLGALLSANVPPSVVFSGFALPAVWTSIPALFYGFALAKTGLGRRIAYFGLKSFKISYVSLMAVWTIIGVVLSLCTPSMTVRIVIISPIVLDCVNACGLEKGSKGRSLILLTAWAMSLIPSAGWFTGSLSGPVFGGILSSVEGFPPITFHSWASVALFPALLSSALLLISGYLILKPETEISVNRAVFVEEYKKLPQMSKEEIVTSVVLAGSFIMFLTSSLHRVPDASICLFGITIFALFGIIRTPDLSSGISWNLVLLNGSFLSFTAIFTVSGVSNWLSNLLLPLFAPIAGNRWLFVLVVMSFLFFWRFFDVALLVPTVVILSSVIPTLGEIYGINPLVWIPMFALATCAFFLPYQNIFCMITEANHKGQGWERKYQVKYAIAFFISCLIAMFVVIPYWTSIGMFNY